MLPAALRARARTAGLPPVAEDEAAVEAARGIDLEPRVAVAERAREVLEVRRDLLVPDYTPFEEMGAEPARVDRVASPLVAAIDAWLVRHGR